ncbi:MAG: hypothetical protein F4Y47_08890 [Acidobacteriia bacterium]|nr:hypothetical protein [Terriglobia bacterium]
MTVIKRTLQDGTVIWDVRVYLGINPETGKRVVKIERSYPTKRDAQDREAELRLKYRKTGRVHSVTVAEHLDNWLRRHAQELDENTASAYRAIIDRDLVPTFGDMMLKDVKPTHVQDWIGHLMSPESGRGRNGQGLDPNSMRQILKVLSAAMQDAEVLELLDRNAARGAKVP